MNKERFHNALALKLGYSRILNDKVIAINIDDSSFEPIVELNIVNKPQCFIFNASEDVDVVWGRMKESQSALALASEIKEIINAASQAYIESVKAPFSRNNQ